MAPERVLIVLLRMGALVTMCAFFAIFLPVDFMAATHERLGLGAFPRTAVVDYLTRSVAALYGFHGVFVWIVSRDPARYRVFVWYVAFMNIAFGAMMLGIGLHAGLPRFWSALEGPSVAAFGIAIAVAAKRAW